MENTDNMSNDKLKKEPKMYINRNEFYDEILKSKELGELTPKAAKMFVLLSEKVPTKIRHKFKSIDDMNDCKQYGLLVLLTKWQKFDFENYDNPFAYYTEIFKKAMSFQNDKLYKHRGDPNKNTKVISYSGAADKLISLNV